MANLFRPNIHLEGLITDMSPAHIQMKQSSLDELGPPPKREMDLSLCSKDKLDPYVTRPKSITKRLVQIFKGL